MFLKLRGSLFDLLFESHDQTRIIQGDGALIRQHTEHVAVGVVERAVERVHVYVEVAEDLVLGDERGNDSADVVVIGGGFTGLSAALELAEAGYSVAVLEAGRVGAGASGRNGGQVCTGFSPGQARLESQVSKDDARKCFDIAEDAKRLIEARIAKHKIDCNLTWGYQHFEAYPNWGMDGAKLWITARVWWNPRGR